MCDLNIKDPDQLLFFVSDPKNLHELLDDTLNEEDKIFILKDRLGLANAAEDYNSIISQIMKKKFSDWSNIQLKYFSESINNFLMDLDPMIYEDMDSHISILTDSITYKRKKNSLEHVADYYVEIHVKNTGSHIFKSTINPYMEKITKPNLYSISYLKVNHKDLISDFHSNSDIGTSWNPKFTSSILEEHMLKILDVEKTYIIGEDAFAFDKDNVFHIFYRLSKQDMYFQHTSYAKESGWLFPWKDKEYLKEISLILELKS